MVISYGWQVSWPDQVVVYGPELLDGVASPNLLHCVEVRRLLVLLVRVFLPILVSQRACVRSVLLKRLGRLAPAHIEEREPRMKGSTLGLGVGQVGQVTGSVGKVRLSGLDTRPVRGVYDRIFFLNTGRSGRTTHRHVCSTIALSARHQPDNPLCRPLGPLRPHDPLCVETETATEPPGPETILWGEFNLQVIEFT